MMQQLNAHEHASKEATATSNKEIQIPEWDEAGKRGAAPHASRIPQIGAVATRTLDRFLPPHRRYFGRARRFLLISAGIATICVLGLIIGLAVGLSHRKSSTKALALPSNRDTFSGDLTYYATGLGACGWTNTDSQDIVAVSHILFDAAGSTSSNGGNSNANPLCGKMIRATRFDSGAGEQRSVDLKVVDRCVGCREHDIDVSESAFEHMADMSLGRVRVDWAWLS